MGFLSPWFLAGLAAVGLPLWLHLLRQFRRTPQPFSSLMFFERRVQSSVRHRRLRYLMLLALRLALLVLLALAFANPFVLRSSASQNRRKLTLIAVDRSFSMREGDHMEKAKDEARRLVRGLPSGFLAQIAALDSHLETQTAYESERSALTAAIDSITVGDDASSYGELARALRLLDKTANMQIEAHFISDMQQTSLPSKGFVDLQLEPGTTLELHSVSEPKKENWAVENVTVASQIFDPKRSRLTATVAGWQTPAASRQVSLVLNNKAVASKSIAVPANGRAQVEFLGFDVPYGANRGEIRIEPHDSLPQDDSYLFSLEREDPRRILFLYAGGRSREGFYYKAAMESSSATGLLVDQAPFEQASYLDLRKFVFVVLSDPGELDSAVKQKLRAYVEKGGRLLIAAGIDTARFGALPVTGEKVSGGNLAQAAGEVDTQHPALSEVGRFENVQFLHSARVQPNPNAKVIAKFADGSPLLTDEAIGEGRVLTFAGMLDSSSSDFPLHASYLPFVVQSGLYLSGASDIPSSVVVGTPATLRHAKSETTAADVIGPTGKHELPLGDAAKAMSFNLAQAGFYEVQSASGRRSLMAVHPDRRESDLTVIPDETLTLWRNTGSTASVDKTAKTQTLATPWSLWRFVLILVLIAACVESVFAAQYLKEERETA
jgi:Aerotolerance regulator N-terminal